MAQVVINLRAKDDVSQVISQLEAKIKKLRQSGENIRISASSGGKGGNGGGGKSGLEGLFGSLVGANLVANGINQLGTAIVGLGKAAFDQARIMEQAQKRLALSSGRYGAMGQLERVGQFAQQTGLSKEVSMESYSKFALSAGEAGLTSTQQQDVFQSTSKMVAALGLGAEESKGIFTAMQQMLAKQKVSTEELLQIAERGVPIFALGAKAMGISQKELTEKLQKGDIAAKQFILNLSKINEQKYGEAAMDNFDSLEGQINNLNNSFFDLKTAMADAFGSSTLNAIATLGQAISGLTTLTKIFFGESMQGAGKLKAASFMKGEEGKRISELTAAGDVKGIQAGQKTATQNFNAQLDQLTKKIGTPGLSGIIGERLTNKIIEERNFYKLSGDEESKQRLIELTKKAQERIEKAPRQGALATALQNSPLAAGPVGGLMAVGGALSGSTANEKLLKPFDKLLVQIQDAGISADAWNTAASDINKIKKGEKEAASLVGKEPKSEKMKSDFHTPRIVNINILSGDGAALISGGITNEFNTSSVDVNSFRTQLQGLVEQTMMDVVTNAGTSLARVSTNKYGG